VKIWHRIRTLTIALFVVTWAIAIAIVSDRVHHYDLAFSGAMLGMVVGGIFTRWLDREKRVVVMIPPLRLCVSGDGSGDLITVGGKPLKSIPHVGLAALIGSAAASTDRSAWPAGWHDVELHASASGLCLTRTQS